MLKQTLQKWRRRLRMPAPPGGGIRLNLGCGQDYRPGWINIDAGPTAVIDVRADFTKVGGMYAAGTVSEVMMIHSIGYLRLWQARDLFRAIHALLNEGGRLIIETPDAAKCAKLLVEGATPDETLEALRAFYAFDLDQVARREEFSTYAFGWTASLLKKELSDAGFQRADECEPQTHGPRPWRDLRVEAVR